MSSSDRKVTLIFDEMAIKWSSDIQYSKRDSIQWLEDYRLKGRSRFVANNARVFLARGLFTKWKQPFAFFFTSSTLKDIMLKNIIVQAITELFSLQVVGCRRFQLPFLLPQWKQNICPLWPLSTVEKHSQQSKKEWPKVWWEAGLLEVCGGILWARLQVSSKLWVKLATKLTKRHVELPHLQRSVLRKK